METRSHTRANSTTNFRYQPYYQRTSKRESFTDSQFKIWKQRPHFRDYCGIFGNRKLLIFTKMSHYYK